MRRGIWILVLAAPALFAAAWAAQPDRSIDHGSFRPRFAAALGTVDFEVAEEASASGDRVRLPLSIRLHPRYWRRVPPALVISGFPDRADRYKLVRDGSQPIDCFVRYLGGRATVIAIHSSAERRAAARALHSALAREFPGFTITLITNGT